MRPVHNTQYNRDKGSDPALSDRWIPANTLLRAVRYLASVTCILAGTCFAAPPDRQVAITIDDLPAGAAYSMSAATITSMTSRLLAILREQKIPAVGFVNEKKLYKFGEVDERIKALSMWVDSGFELGNHTFSHASLNQVGLKAWEDEIVQGETVTRLLLAQHNMKLRYFRHPYLDTGRDLETRREAEAFLVARGYRIAPVTLDAWDWMYARVYEDAKQRGDTALQQQLVTSYLSYSDAVFAYAEQLSKELVGYEPKQIILLHANELEADHLNELLDVMRKRGYRFITLENALGYQAYSMSDTYVGEEGTDWLDHWATTRGKPAQGHPDFPQWVLDRDKALPHPPPAP
jgi:peptidoglycan-N-acetylglucosamine deacetylase